MPDSMNMLDTYFKAVQATDSVVIGGHVTQVTGLLVESKGPACSIGGLALLTKAVGDLFGKLVIDESGIAIHPAFTGYSIAWSELSQWDVNLDADFPEAHSVRFWTPSSPCALSIPNSWLNHHDRTQIRRCLLSHAAAKAAQPNRTVGQ